MGGKWYLSILPMILVSVGAYLTGKDPDTKGSDDVVGNILLAAAPAVSAIQENNNESAVRKAVKAIRDAADAYLNQTAPAPQ